MTSIESPMYKQFGNLLLKTHAQIFNGEPGAHESLLEIHEQLHEYFQSLFRGGKLTQTVRDHILGDSIQLDYPGGKDGFYIVPCSCGYKTAPNGTEARAFADAKNHQRAQNRNNSNAIRGVLDSSITCPRCKMTSYNPNDVVNGYCGNCHDYTSTANSLDDPTLPDDQTDGGPVELDQPRAGYIRLLPESTEVEQNPEQSE